MAFIIDGKSRPAGPGDAPAGAGGTGVVIEGSTATFMRDVIEASTQVPVIVDFWAPWCGPCKQLGPMLEKLVRQAGGAVRMVKINVDENQDLAAQLRIQSLPTVYAFVGGQPADGFQGALPESQLKQFIKRLSGGAGNPIDQALGQAKELMEAGDTRTAQQIFAKVLEADPTNAAAAGGLLRCHQKAGDLKAARKLLAKLPPELQDHPEVSGVRTAIELIEQGGGGGKLRDLRRKVEADPDDHQARIDLAMALYAEGDREGAVDHLLDSIRRDRTWNEEAARKQLVKLFEAFGQGDPLTLRTRRKLSSLLFS